MNETKSHHLDITTDVCPITFVKTKLLLEKMPSGAVVTVRLRGAEPLENVPRSVRAHGHEVLSLVPEDPGQTDHSFAHILTIKRT
jgi:TusA-related sulfurtransferase